jgi:hypothetical protein
MQGERHRRVAGRIREAHLWVGVEGLQVIVGVVQGRVKLGAQPLQLGGLRVVGMGGGAGGGGVADSFLRAAAK